MERRTGRDQTNKEIANQKAPLTLQVAILTSGHGLADERSQLYAEEDEEERLRELEEERLALQIKFKTSWKYRSTNSDKH